MSIPSQLIDIAGRVIDLEAERNLLAVRVKHLLEQNNMTPPGSTLVSAMLTILEYWLKGLCRPITGQAGHIGQRAELLGGHVPTEAAMRTYVGGNDATGE